MVVFHWRQLNPMVANTLFTITTQSLNGSFGIPMAPVMVPISGETLLYGAPPLNQNAAPHPEPARFARRD